MKSNCRCHEIVKEGFEELALALGGVTASYEIPDAAVWDLALVVDAAYDRVQARISKNEVVAQLEVVQEPDFRHTAVTYLLQRIRQSGPDSDDEGRAA